MAKAKATKNKAIPLLKTPTILADGVLQFSTIVTSIALVFLTIGFYLASNQTNKPKTILEEPSS